MATTYFGEKFELDHVTNCYRDKLGHSIPREVMESGMADSWAGGVGSGLAGLLGGQGSIGQAQSFQQGLMGQQGLVSGGRIASIPRGVAVAIGPKIKVITTIREELQRDTDEWLKDVI